MTETSKVQSWAYPSKIGSAEVSDPQQYYNALAKARDGYFPLGKNGLWHGGVHLDDASGLVAEHGEVRCIADGEVIAYRIDEQYPTSLYGEKSAVYSTGFVLVKHRLEVPAPPVAAGAPAPTTPAPALTFYSLYMHLLDWQTYSNTPSLAAPSYWNGGELAVSATATDPMLGLNVRSAHTNGSIIGWLPRGTVVTTGEVHGHKLKVVSVSPALPELTGVEAWVYGPEMKAQGENQYLIADKAVDKSPSRQNGLNVRAQGSRTAEILRVLPAGTKVTIDETGTSDYCKLLSVLSDASVPPLAAGADGSIPGYIWKKSLEAKREPAAKGSVVVLPTPVAVKAGAVIGHVGKLQNHDDAQPRNLLHLEVFTCEDFPAFVAKSKTAAAALPDDQKTLVKIYKGTKVIPHQEGINQSNPPTISSPGLEVGFDQIIPLSVLESLPAEKKIKVETPHAVGQPTVVYWWHLEGVLGGADNNPVSGWVAEQDLISTRHNPWEWEGFDFLEETSTNLQNWGTYLHDQNRLTEDEKSVYKPAPNGPVKARLYDIIDADKNEKLTVAEIVAALSKPWHAQSISQLAVKYESEWLYKAEKWNALDELMGTPNESWTAEKARIEKMAWWGDLAGKQGIGADGVVWHLHLAGIIAAYTASYPRKRRDYDLGRLSTRYETGGRGPKTVSGGTGDAGGVSYGSYQMTSQTKDRQGNIRIGGTVARFVNGTTFPWKSSFQGLTPGTLEFSSNWRSLVGLNGDEFARVEHEFIKKELFDVQMEYVLSESDVDLRYHSHTLNDVVWSTAVQQGGKTDVIVRAINNIGQSHVETKAYDKLLISEIYAERGKRITQGDKQGQLAYFSGNSIAVQEGVANRFLSESREAIGRLENEENY